MAYLMQALSRNKLPKHVIAEQELLRVIENGEFPAGSKLPGIRELATRFDIAPMTLRHALGRLADQGILERRQRVGTFVREGKVFPNIGILFFHVRSISATNLPSLTLQMLAKSAEVKKRRVHAMLMTSPLPSATQVYEELRSLNVGAVALQGFLEEERSFISNLASHIPCVLFNKGLTGLNLPCATPDGFAAGRIVVDYAASRQRKLVACGRFVTGHRVHQEFLMTVEAELLRRGLNCNKNIWLEASGHDSTLVEATKWVDTLIAPGSKVDTLVLASKDLVTHAIERMKAIGETPGKERDIITFFGGTMAPTEHAEYATLAYNDLAAVEASTKILMDILDGHSSPEARTTVRIPPKLILPSA